MSAIISEINDHAQVIRNLHQELSAQNEQIMSISSRLHVVESTASILLLERLRKLESETERLQDLRRDCPSSLSTSTIKAIRTRGMTQLKKMLNIKPKH